MQTYVYLKPDAVAGAAEGYYYYDSRGHRLIPLGRGAPDLEEVRFGAANIALYRQASFAIFLVAQMQAIRPIYGEQSERFAAIEAGLMTQLLEMHAPECGVGLCQIGGLDFSGLNERFLLDEGHQLLHCLTGGPVESVEDPLQDFHANLSCAAVPPAAASPVAPRPATPAETRDLRARLATILPAHMIPSRFVFHSALPTTSNGKIDRQALIAPATRYVEEPAPISLPLSVASAARSAVDRSAIVAVLTSLWREVLSVPNVDETSEFFALGGNSLSAISISTRVQERFGVAVPITTLLESGTLGGIATFITTALNPSTEAPQPRLSITPDRENLHQPFPLTPVQQAYWVGRSTALSLGGVATHNYVELEMPDLDLDRLELALNTLIRRHAMLRAVALPGGQQQILPLPRTYRIECGDLRDLPPAEQQQRLLETRQMMSHRVFVAEQWPLFELRAHRIDARGYRLHFSIDLLIADARSVQILRDDLLAIYENPGVSEPPPFEISFRDYVLAASRQTAGYGQARDYWMERLRAPSARAGVAVARQLDRSAPRHVSAPPVSYGASGLGSP